jgi:CheY-like chemotaxis protein
MLVEDDPDIALLAQIALEEFGNLVFVHFFSGREALKAVEAGPPDMVILDYRMPEMNGEEVLRALRQTNTGRDLPVIFMTASLMPKHVGRLRELGALDVIGKPFDPLTLADQVKEIWAKHHRSSATM